MTSDRTSDLLVENYLTGAPEIHAQILESVKQAIRGEKGSYKASLLLLLSEKSKHAIPNGNHQAIADWYELLFLLSRTSIRIFARDLKAEYFNDPRVIKAAEVAATRGTPIALLYSSQAKRSALLDIFNGVSKSGGKVALIPLDDGVFEEVAEFSVFDNRAARLAQHVNEGLIVVNDQSIILRLVQYFDEKVPAIEFGPA